MKAFFISDIHLTSDQDPHTAILLRFLRDLPQDTTHLIFLGDIFDLWVGGSTFFYKKHQLVIDSILDLAKKGVQIHIFEGNHDFHMKSFWKSFNFITVHTQEYYFDFDDYIVRAEHGDMANPLDHNYFLLKRLLTGRPIKDLSNILPGALINWIGEKSSAFSGLSSRKALTKQEKIKTVLEQSHLYAKKVYQLKPFHLLVMGHTHIEDQLAWNDKETIQYINLGSWSTQPKALLVLNKKSEIISLN